MKTRKATLKETLTKVEDEFIDMWNNMGALWGISPTMARIHGLLYITGAALSMDDIMARLAISRGNVSMNLSKLLEWGLVRRVHQRGGRKEFFASLSDVWEMFTLVASQRKRREIDPLLNMLRRCREDLSPDILGARADENEVQKRSARINELYKFLALVDDLAQRFFASHRSLREAVHLLVKDEGE